MVYLNASITLFKFPIMMQTQIWATNLRWGGTTFKSSQPCLMPMPNTVIGHSWLLHYVAKQKCDDQIWTVRKILQEITVQQLTWTEVTQLTCLNASITLSKFPTMMQTQIQATNMRWGGTTFKSSQPCLMPMPNTVISHSWPDYVAKQKCDDQIWTGRKILQEITLQQSAWTWCKISQLPSMHQ